MKTTKYFDTLKLRVDRSIIKEQWIQQVVNSPEKELIQLMDELESGPK